METTDRSIGPLRFLGGPNRGRYPHCHSLFIEEAGVLIDPASDRETLIALRMTDRVQMVWLSHWHEDHWMHLDLFDDLPLWISAADAPPLAAMNAFLDAYGLEDPAEQDFWHSILTDTFHFTPRRPARLLRDGDRIALGTITAEIIATPGHTPGHLAFYFPEVDTLFLGDYDLTTFGPWYGDRFSSIGETRTSIRRLRSIPARIWLTAHETGIYTHPPGELWDRYDGVITLRERKLLSALETPRTVDELVRFWIVYGKAREPEAFYRFGERAHIRKHLEELLRNGQVDQSGERFRRIF